MMLSGSASRLSCERNKTMTAAHQPRFTEDWHFLQLYASVLWSFSFTLSASKTNCSNFVPKHSMWNYTFPKAHTWKHALLLPQYMHISVSHCLRKHKRIRLSDYQTIAKWKTTFCVSKQLFRLSNESTEICKELMSNHQISLVYFHSCISKKCLTISFKDVSIFSNLSYKIVHNVIPKYCPNKMLM